MRTKRDHRVGTSECVPSVFNVHKLGRLLESLHGKMVQEMKNCLLLCLKLCIWDRECVEEMGPNDLVDLIAFTELEII